MKLDTGSIAIKADSLHYLGDLLVNGAVILALLAVSRLGWVHADPIFGLGIAAYILYNAWVIARGALDMLMDRELPEGIEVVTLAYTFFEQQKVLN